MVHAHWVANLKSKLELGPFPIQMAHLPMRSPWAAADSTACNLVAVFDAL
jgi:hypothetical protein